MQAPSFLLDRRATKQSATPPDTVRPTASDQEDRERTLTENEVYRVIMEEMARLTPRKSQSAA